MNDRRHSRPDRGPATRRVSAAPSARSSFTLVELLVVMGIFALLMAVAMPVVLNRGPGVAAKGAVSRLKSTIALARQWAVTRRVTTYVVFPDATNSFTASGEPPWSITAMRGYNIWTAEDGYLNEWAFLPPGFVFDNATTGANAGENIFGTGADRRFEVRMPLDTSATQTVSCISFKPNGRLNQNGGTTLQVFFTQGNVDANTSNGAVSNYVKVATARRFGVRVQPLTGRLKVTEFSP